MPGFAIPGPTGHGHGLARLPVAANGKHAPPFRCRMVRLVAGIALLGRKNWWTVSSWKSHKLSGPSARISGGRRRSRWTATRCGFPPPAENAVLAALHERGLYKAPLGNGKHDITCPWVEEHTDTVDGGTAYFEPDDNWPIGGFKCLHGQCAGRHIRDLLEVLDIEAAAARMKPTIRVIAGEIHRVVDAAERELAQSLRHYQRGGLIVTVVTDPGTRETRVQDLSATGFGAGAGGHGDLAAF